MGFELAFFGTLLLGFLVNSLLSIIPGYIASQKGRSAVAFWVLGTFVSFVISLLAVMAIPRGEQPSSKLRAESGGDTDKELLELPEEIKCPNCAEYVKFEAKICRFCSNSIEQHAISIRNKVASNMDAFEKELAEEKAERGRHFEEVDQMRRDKIAAFKKTFTFKLLLAVLSVALTFAGLATYKAVETKIASQNKTKTLVAELRSIVDECAKRVQIADLKIVEADNGLRILKSDFFANSNIEDSKFEACMALQATDFNQIEQTYATGYGSTFLGLKAEYSYELRFDFSENSTWSSGAAKATMPTNVQEAVRALGSCQIQNTFPMEYDDLQNTWQVMLNFLEPGVSPTTAPETRRHYITASQAKCFNSKLKSTPGVERWLWPGWYVYDIKN